MVLLAGLKDDRGRVFERVVGLDVSPKAMDEARRRFENEIKEAGNIEFVKGDFFANEEWAKEGPYDVVYDYTVSPTISSPAHFLSLISRGW